MEYSLVKSTVEDIDRLISYKKETIFAYAKDLTNKEIDKINNYINENVPKEIDDYFNIVIDGNIKGCLLITKKNDGVLIDELYIEEEVRNKGIGTDIINKVINDNNIVYLWVYKDNNRAISLYNKLGFKVLETTDSRYFMCHKK